MKADLVKLTAPALAPDGAARKPVPVRPGPGPQAAPVDLKSLDAAAQALASAEQARAAVEQANRKLAEKSSELTIEFDDDLGRMVFRLVDTQTREVVRQIPSQEVLAIARALAADKSSGVMLRDNA